MLRKLLNQATFDLRIDVQGPLLIKSGLEGGADPSLPDMQFVRTRGEVLYIPGSSLKGVFRSYAEKIARTVGASCCNPFDDKEGSLSRFCGKRFEKETDGRKIYKDSCRICKLFGSTAMASRIKFNDAYPDGDVRPETRTGVAIDRVLGSVAHGPFDFEVVTEGKFDTSITLRNFELWQVGLLGLVLRDMEDGLVPIGFGKSRGLGDVKVEVRSLKVRYISEVPSGDSTSSLYGVGVLVSDEERRDYGFQEEDTVRLSLKGEPVDGGLMGVAVSFGREGIQEIFRKCVERWKAVVEDDRS